MVIPSLYLSPAARDDAGRPGLPGVGGAPQLLSLPAPPDVGIGGGCIDGIQVVLLTARFADLAWLLSLCFFGPPFGLTSLANWERSASPLLSVLFGYSLPQVS